MLGGKAVRIGVDVIYFKRMEGLRPMDSDPFLLDCFSDREREEARRRSRPAVYFASRFAAKEALFKTLHIDGDRLRCSDVEVLQEENGSLTVVPGPRMQAVMEEQGLQGVDVSISWEEDLAVAAAIAW